MLKQLNKSLKFGMILIITIILTLGFSISLQSLLAAWTAPSANPPANNALNLTVSGITFAIGGLRASDPSFLLGNVGVGTTSDILPSHNAKVFIQASSAGEGLRVISSAGWSPFVVMNNTDTADLFRVKQDGNVCIGGVCKNTWPASGATYTAGTGLTLTGSSFSVNTIAIQNRVSGTCSVGSSIRTINADGTVACQADGGMTSETDPQVGTLTSGKWCTSNGSTVNCASNAPSSGLSGLYSCPSKTGCDNGQLTMNGSTWDSFGCVGQISKSSTCTNYWYQPGPFGLGGLKSCANACTLM